MEFRHRFSDRSQMMTPSPIRKLVPLMREPGMISFGGGYPNASTFAFSTVDIAFKSGITYTIDHQLIDLACQYGPTDGHPFLLPGLQKWHVAKDGWMPQRNQIQVLNGSQEGLHIMAYLFLNHDDWVAVSEPAYPGALGAFRAFTKNFLSFPIDGDGSITTELERRLTKHRSTGLPMPKFIYEVPSGHNPGGVRLSLERRHHLLSISHRFDIPILEDDPYQLVQLEESTVLPTLQRLDTKGQVIRLDSFSKIFAPGLRLGYATGPSEVIQMFNLYKQGTNLHVSSMIQVILAGFLEKHEPDDFFRLIRANCRIYRSNRDVMIDSARRFLPESVHFNVPVEGMFLWIELPIEIDAELMLDRFGMEYKVLMVPGSAFSTCGGLKHCMRLSFSMVTHAEITEGMKRLGAMIQKMKS
ncbi:PLP-dependent aminotransferase family protein [bacterium]|nr:PLP-dependent aminotransferase family protein [candidate division CSSED10-310 bacterium]